jgi:serine-type D-Ala-D-Ala carboxypeptidase/endopeptidase (penicillin-binding protein 4)
VTRRKLVGFTLFAVALAVTAALLFSTLRPPATTSAPADTRAVRTPLWSARRVPGLLTRTVESAAQARASDSLTTLVRAIVAPVDACVAVDGPAGPLARVGADTPLPPASTLKVLTALTAIDRLGPDHRFTTRVLTDASGNLVVVGGGDPLLATAEHIAYEHTRPRFRNAPYSKLSDLADAIVAAGVHDVSGALLVDDQAHDTLRTLPTWKAGYTLEGDVGSLGALAVDGGYDRPTDQMAAADPAISTGQRLAGLLAARGVTIADGVRRGTAPGDAHEIAHLDSPPLSDIVGEMLTSSDDFTAEILLRDVAVGTNGRAPATTEMGVRIAEQEMTRLGIPAAGFVMLDGSGLSTGNRASCTTLLRLIEITGEPKFAAVDRGLAVAARTGTLANRFVGDSLAGKLRGKTGTIDGVVGLVGIVDRPDDLHFAFLANGDFSTGAGERMQAAVAGAVGSTPDLRAPPDLVPAP